MQCNMRFVISAPASNVSEFSFAQKYGTNFQVNLLGHCSIDHILPKTLVQAWFAGSKFLWNSCE